MKINTPISAGELIDKISILKIKSLKIKDEDKLKNIKTELKELQLICSEKFKKEVDLESKIEELFQVNLSLWNIEDQIRQAEAAKSFDTDFVFLARSVYKTNDKRFDIKNKINKEFGSYIVEEKSYEKY